MEKVLKNIFGRIFFGVYTVKTVRKHVWLPFCPSVFSGLAHSLLHNVRTQGTLAFLRKVVIMRKMW